MAGDWIPISVDLLRKREVILLCGKTGWSRYEVVGRLVEFWAWVSSESTNGVIEGLTAELLSTVGRFDPRFISALEEVGWLSWSEAGLVIPNFDRWLSNSAKNRVLSTERKRRQRSRQLANHSGGCEACVTQVSRKCHADVTQMSRSERDKNVTREEKRREEKKREEKSRESNPTSTSIEMDNSIEVEVQEKLVCPETKFCGEIGQADSPPEVSPELSKVPEEVARLAFACDGPIKQWRIDGRLYQALQEAFTTIDLDGEIRKAWAWLMANPDKRKTARGMSRFLFHWMSRSVDNGKGVAKAGGAPPRTLADRNLAVARAFLQRMEGGVDA